MKGFYALHNKCVTQPSSERLDKNIDEILNVSERKDDKSTFVQLWNFTQLYYSFHCPTLTKVHTNLESIFFRNHRKPKLEAGIQSITFHRKNTYDSTHKQRTEPDIEMYQVCHLSALNLSPLCFQSSDSNPLDLAGFW